MVMLLYSDVIKGIITIKVFKVAFISSRSNNDKEYTLLPRCGVMKTS